MIEDLRKICEAGEYPFLVEYYDQDVQHFCKWQHEGRRVWVIVRHRDGPALPLTGQLPASACVALLLHFGLYEVKEVFHPQALVNTPPVDLLRARRALEREWKADPISVYSDDPNFRISANFVW